MPTQQHADTAFKAFDAAHFAGALAASTTVVVKTMAQGMAGGNHSGGTIIEIGSNDGNWEETLIHEMVHALEFQFPGQITVTTEGTAARNWFSQPFFRLSYAPHSAEFFSKLFEVMKARGDDPSKDFDRYFG